MSASEAVDGSEPSLSTSSSVASARRKPWVIHPVVFGVFPIVALYARNIYEARPSDLSWPVALALGVVLLAWALAFLVIRDRYRSGLIVSLAVGCFFTAKHASEALSYTWNWLCSFWVMNDVNLPIAWGIGFDVVVALALGLTVLFWWRETTIWSLTKYLNVFGLVLLAMPIGSILITRTDEPAPSRSFKPAPALPLARSGRPAKLPDIYYIILDGFARADVQKQVFGYDLEPFLAGLERRGFYVARQSTANYCQTPLCLSSSLNANYLDAMLTRKSQDIGETGTLIGQGAVVRAVRSLGYKFESYATGFEQTEQPQADVYRSPFQYLRAFHRMLLDETPLISFMPNPKERDFYTMTRERTLHIFDTLPDIARDRAPTFTFAHILVPHPPFVFGENGEDVSPRESRYLLSDGTVFRAYYPDIDYVTGYRAEVIYVTRQIDQVIDKILAESPEPPIIIVQSDHGSGSRLDTESLENSDLHERMSILNAYYLPGQAGRDAGLYETITPVNSFRVVFNAYLGAQLPLLPDRNYFSTWGAPFKFIDVTDKVLASQNAIAETRESQ